MTNFSIQEIWNKSLELKSHGFELKPRNYLRASEIGKSYLDVYLSMKGTEPSNPYDDRGRRKFAAGRLFEWLVGEVFRSTGLDVKTNESITPIKTDGLLPVYGHYDFLVKGRANWDESRKVIKERKYSEEIEKICLRLVDWLQEKYPILYDDSGAKVSGLPETLYEIKSVNSQVFWAKKEYLMDAYPEHKLQDLTYMMGLKMDSCQHLYISKDDLTLAEFEIRNTSELRTKWLLWVKQMTYHIMEDKEPAPEDDIVFDEEKKRWDLNWKVKRSVYLSHITGLSSDEWENQWSEVCKTRNRAIGAEKAKKTRKAKKEALASKGA